MKKISLFLTLATVMLMFFSSCSKIKDATNGALDTGQADIKASFTGSISGSFQSVNIGSMASKTPVMINLSGNTTSLPVKTFMITIPANVTIGNHRIENEDGWALNYTNNASEAFNDTWAAPLDNNAPDFVVNVTKVSSTEIEGTFSGTMYNIKTSGKTIKITNASFKAKF